MSWLIYGANGYTGRLIAERAARLGLNPILAGRGDEVASLASGLGLPCRRFGLDDPAELREGLRGIRLVLHCAGPFSATSRPMLDACLEARAHYLDITGEIDVFESVFARAEEIRAAGITAIPGTGFDVVPSDCLAAMLKRRLPGAKRLALAFLTTGRSSPGTSKSIVEGIAQGGRIRRDGKIVAVPAMHHARVIDYGEGPRYSVTIPWGDVSTAYYSTGIPYIEVFIPGSQLGRAVSRVLAPGVSRLLRIPRVKRGIQGLIGRHVTGLDAEERERAYALLWGEATDDAGNQVRLRMRTPDGYDLTADAASACVDRLINAAPGVVPAGPLTPSMAFGADFALGIPGVSVEEA